MRFYLYAIHLYYCVGSVWQNMPLVTVLPCWWFGIGWDGLTPCWFRRMEPTRTGSGCGCYPNAFRTCSRQGIPLPGLDRLPLPFPTWLRGLGGLRFLVVHATAICLGQSTPRRLPRAVLRCGVCRPPLPAPLLPSCLPRFCLPFSTLQRTCMALLDVRTRCHLFALRWRCTAVLYHAATTCHRASLSGRGSALLP